MLLSILMIAILGLMVIPANAFVNPNGTSSPTVNSNYELYGPHVAGLNNIIYVSPQAELTAMITTNTGNSGSANLDLEDVLPLTAPWDTAFKSNPSAFTVVGYNSGDTVMSNTPAAQPAAGYWEQFVNEPTVGLDNWYTTLDAVDPTATTPSTLYMQCGSSWDIKCLNVLNPQSPLDNTIIGLIYDSGARYDPTNTNWMPQLFENWAVGTWTGYAGNTYGTYSYVNLTLRPDVYWQDGVPLTMADVKYSLYNLGTDLANAGITFRPPWWTGNYIAGFWMNDEYNLQVLLNANVPSATALQYVLSPYIIPKHIWHPLITQGTPAQILASFADPFVIGSGPYRFHSYGAGLNLVLDANTPGSTETQGSTTITSPGYYQYYPLRVDISLGPANLAKVGVGVPAGSIIPYYANVYLYNLDPTVGSSLTVNEYIYVVSDTSMANAFADLPTTPGSGATYTRPGLWLPSVGVSSYDTVPSDTYPVPLTLLVPSATVIEVACQIMVDTGITTTAGPAYVNAWIIAKQPIWATNTADVGGSNLYTDLRYSTTSSSWLTPDMQAEAPTPDLKVDGRDITMCAKAFGTVPGQPRWNPVCDVNHDYKIDGRDITIIAKQFGWQ
jgi:hypothetical protein